MGKQMKKYKAKYGATLKRFDKSGFVFDQNSYTDWIKQNPEYTDKNHPIKDLNSITAKSIYRPMYAEYIYNQYGVNAYNTVVNEFSKRPGGYTTGKDIDYNITQYKFSPDPKAPGSWANAGGRWSSDNPSKRSRNTRKLWWSMGCSYWKSSTFFNSTFFNNDRNEKNV